ncbi:S10 family serine carboxypeptidase-like protein [Phyllobacterium bourgognense]|nr:hypothetical protein [Phyllobacterium bourgognense]
MNFRFLLLLAALGLSACSGSGSSDSSTKATSTFDAETAVAQAKLDGLNAEIGQKIAVLTAAGTKLTETEQADAALGAKTRDAEEKLAGLLVEAAAKTKDVETAGATLKDRRDELAGLEGPDGRIETLNRQIAGLEETRDGLAGVKDGVSGEIATLKIERDDLQKRLLELKGDPDGANDEKKLGTIKLAEKELSARTDELIALTGNPKDPTKPGTIKLAMAELATYKGKDGLIEKAEAELARLDKLKDAALDDTKAAKLDAAHIRSDSLIETGRFAEAAKVLEAAGLTTDGASLRVVEAFVKDGKIIEAAGELTKLAPRKSVAALYTRAGMDEEAYKLYAPPDYVLVDNTHYSGSAGAKLTAAVDEKPSVKRQKMTLNGKTVWFTASAGHLTAFAKNPEKRSAQASIFYTAYTRDDLPKADRPVTFFFNGGPGASSVYLHLASWAPKHVVIDALNVPDAWANGRPQAFDFIESQESLIDKTDLVFVDIVPGTGFSQAIAPHTNQKFWDTSKDVDLSRQFITRYINFNRRQESPKYLYGESYGGGIRVPKLTQALVDAGTTGYETVAAVDKSRFKVLTGAVFHSPAFDYSSMGQVVGAFPTFAMVADALGKSTARAKQTSDVDYAETLRGIATQYSAEAEFTASSYTGLPDRIPEDYWGLFFKGYMEQLMPSYSFNAYDGRMHVKLETVSFDIPPQRLADVSPQMFLNRPKPLSYDFNFFEEDALYNRITTHLPEYMNYKSKSHYINVSWQTTDPVQDKGPEVAFELWKGRDGASGLRNIVAAIGMDPSLKLLTVHGYHDTVTPFRRSELDLKGVIIDAATNRTLLDRVPVKNFVGGHMIYYAQESRKPLKRTLDEFYDAPPYGTGPTIVKARDLVAAAPVQRAPVPAVALH